MSGKKGVSFQKAPRTSSNNVKPLDEPTYLYGTKFSSTAVRPSSKQWSSSANQQAARASTENRPPRSHTMKNAAKAAEMHYYTENPSKLPLPTPALTRQATPTPTTSLKKAALPTPTGSSNPTLTGSYISLGTIPVPTGSSKKGGKSRRRKTRKSRKSKKSRKVRRS